jgi:hypothetical protein
MTRPVFVIGTGRCGSTLVHEVLARHELTGFVTNLDDLKLGRSSAWQNRVWRHLPAEVTRKGGTRFAPSEGYRVLAREVGPILVDPVRDLTARDATPWLRERMVTFVGDRSRRLAAPVFLHKFTGWPRTGFLRACFPDALFIEVVRDGRAVANSWLQMPWWRGHRGPENWHFGPLPADLQRLWEERDRSFPVLAALAWRQLMASYDEARSEVPADRWHRIRYEDLVESPRVVLTELLDTMGLTWTESFAAGFDRYHFSAARAEAYRDDLSPDDLADVEEILGDQLRALGYHRRTPSNLGSDPAPW